ncbi:MAG: SUMF1/EgtB/PvdO family nonheme iron enzyme [Planctomycetes bacterium]|nr:SUMF1/EgtB/PvdO family nonheme iron enzyme [Planctomycetota bacterium]
MKQIILMVFVVSLVISFFAGCGETRSDDPIIPPAYNPITASPCAGVNCGTHGTCSNGKCFCIDGYTGDLCETPPHPCTGITCGDHGYCVDGGCVCESGYTGTPCQNIADCSPNLCQNAGICTDGVNSYTCECIVGYTGEFCQINIDDCDPNPCQHNGTCTDGANSYSCECVGGYTGDNCENCVPDCTNRECGFDGCDGTCGFCDAGETCSNGVCSAEMAQIPSGCFGMGDAINEGHTNEFPVHNVCISAFKMDLHEVTNAKYAECVDNGGCKAPSNTGSYTRMTYYGELAYTDYPVIWVDWYQAEDYCKWAGKRLPTEAEWEYAARGGLAGNRYPWGDNIDCDNACYDRVSEASCWDHCHNLMCDNDTHPVEIYTPNGYGLYEMAGNIEEWVNDWWQDDYYTVSPTNDPPGPESGTLRVSRGGSWLSFWFLLRVADRSYSLPENPRELKGFRCAMGGAFRPMYFIGGSNTISRAYLDGSNWEDLITSGLNHPHGIAVDFTRGKIYWTELDGNVIGRSNLDGSNPEDLIATGLDAPATIALDVTGGKLYWSDVSIDSIIGSADLDGSNQEIVINNHNILGDPYGIALDLSAGKIYWTTGGGNSIGRANLDGSNQEILIIIPPYTSPFGIAVPWGIALDVDGGKMYWTEFSRGKIRRANLDGSTNPEDLITGLRRPTDIELDLLAGKLYWTERSGNIIGRANLDGSNREDLITTGLNGPVGIALAPN